MGLEFVAIIGQWLQLIKITQPGLQCSKSQQQTFRPFHILKYLSVVDTAVSNTILRSVVTITKYSENWILEDETDRPSRKVVNIPEQRRLQLHREGSLKSRIWIRRNDIRKRILQAPKLNCMISCLETEHYEIYLLMLAMFESRKIVMNCKGVYPQTSLIWARAWSIVGGKTLSTETSH